MDPDKAQHLVGPDLGQNCMQKLSADDTFRQRVEIGVVFGNVNCILLTTFIFAGHLVSEDAAESNVKSLGKVQRLGPARVTPQTFTRAVCLDVWSEDARSGRRGLTKLQESIPILPSTAQTRCQASRHFLSFGKYKDMGERFQDYS